MPEDLTKEQLAQHTVDSMDLATLKQCVYEQTLEVYDNSDEYYELSLEEYNKAFTFSTLKETE